MRKPLRALSLALVAVAVGAGSCDGPVDDGDWSAVAVCGTVAPNPLTGRPTRAEPESCPAGDVEVPGWPYRWYYEDWDSSRDLDVVYVGQPLDTHWSYVRPARATSALLIYRDVPRDAAAAQVVCGCASPPPRAHIVQRSRSRARTAAAQSGPSGGGAAAQSGPTGGAGSGPPTRSRDIQRGGFGVGAQRARSVPAVSPAAPVKIRTATVKRGKR